MIPDRIFDSLRHRDAFSVTSASTATASLDSLAGHRHLLLVTFRRNGDAAPTPVWFALDGDVVYVKTAAESGKVKRLRRDPRALLAPSTRRGAPVGPVIAAVGQMLEPDEWPRAEDALRRAHGFLRRFSERTLGRTGTAAYLALRARI